MTPTDDQTIALSVIAPCFNEEANIDLLVRRTLAAFETMDVAAELILVDDGSRDRTWDRITACEQSAACVRGVRHLANRGMEAAWRTGLNAAEGGLVCLIDSDLQNRPEDITALYAAYQQGAGHVIQAVRHPAAGVSRIRHFSRGLNLMLNWIFGMKARDNKSGFILCRRDVLADVLQHRFSYRYFQCLLGAAIHARGYRLAEVDTIFEPRHGGQSFLSIFPFWVSLRTAGELLKFRLETWLWPRPAALPKAAALTIALALSETLPSEPRC
jgi:phenylacetate-CoA ligase